MSKRPEVVIVGAGVGGLTTASILAHQGYQVTVLEAQTYAGGSASTFTHKGYRFDSGATVAGGFQPFGPHRVLADMLDIDWAVHRHEPAWVVNLAGQSIPLTADYQAIFDAFPQTEAFWKEQGQIADIAWRMSAQGLPWIPQDLAEWVQLVKVGLSHFPQDLRLIPFALSTVRQWAQLRGHGQNQAFLRFLDATLLISAQTTGEYVNSLYGATAMDLTRQGVYHVEGGIGGIAEALVKKIESLGGNVLFRQHVRRIVMKDGRAVGVIATQGKRSEKELFHPADFVVVNNTPWSLEKLLGDDAPAKLKQEVATRPDTQGAFVLHVGIEADALPNDIADHHQIVRSLQGPMGEGETVFLSMSPAWDKGRAPQGHRAVTISTHTRVQYWWDLIAKSETAYADAKAQFADRILDTITTVIPNFKSAVRLCLPGTPVTYQFYTMRHKGMVGGFPQTSLFKARSPRTGITNVRLVGDSVFPGQSTAGVTLGGIRVAKDVIRHLPISQSQHQNVINFGTTLSVK